MWIASFMEGLQTAFVHNLINILLIFIHRNELMLLHRFSDNLSDRKSWGEGGERILEDDLHLGTHLIHLILWNIVNLSSVKENLPRCLFPAETQNSSSGSGFSATGLSNETHGRSSLDMERDSVNCLYLTDNGIEESALNRKIFF